MIKVVEYYIYILIYYCSSSITIGHLEANSEDVKIKFIGVVSEIYIANMAKVLLSLLYRVTVKKAFHD